jgi:hypothetical protein
VLLFASNVENFIFFMLHGIISSGALYISEVLLACLYLYLVIKNFLWFIEPLSERDEWETLVDSIQDSFGATKDMFSFTKGSAKAPVRGRGSLIRMKTDVDKLLGRDISQRPAHSATKSE